MSLASCLALVRVGVTGQVVEVQAHIAPGLPRTTIVGLADTAVSEAKDRVRSAVSNSGSRWPAQRITVGLSPASQHKHGSGLDLAIAVATLAAAGEVPAGVIGNSAFVGELGLDGSVRSVGGAFAMAAAVSERVPDGTVFVAAQDYAKWTIVGGPQVVPVRTLRETLDMLAGRRRPASPDVTTVRMADSESGAVRFNSAEPELADVVGQPVAARALEVAAAGGHHILISGPPGVGKSMMAHRVIGLLPDLAESEALEVGAIREADGHLDEELVVRPPQQAPHHTASHVAMIGGALGQQVRPGLVSLAHRGVLLLDEAPEFRRETLEALRQPLESGTVTVARAGIRSRLPAAFQLVMTANPCPCGWADASTGCRCTSLARHRYRQRLSGPLLDRVDIHMIVGTPGVSGSAPATSIVRDRVETARDRLDRRVRRTGSVGHTPRCMRDVPSDVIRRSWPWPKALTDFMRSEQERAGRTLRGTIKVMRLAWTIADLAGHDLPRIDDVAEAFALRVVDAW